MKIGVIRGLMARVTQAELAASFKRFKPRFITGEASKEVSNYCKKVGLDQVDLGVKPLWGIDPMKVIFGRRIHQSWVGVKGLTEVCKGLDVLQTYELYHFFSGQAAEVAKQLGIPLVVEVWTSMANHLAYKLPPYKWTVKKVLKTAKLVVARSERAYKALRQLGVEKDRLVKIYHGVNLNRFKPRKRERKDSELRVLFVGKLNQQKGVGMVLKVWEEIVKKEPRARLWLVGEGPFLSQAKQTPGVKIFGAVEHTKMPELYRQVDVFMITSQDLYLGPWLWNEEFFAYVLMEAMACGLAVVGTKCGGIPEEMGGNKTANWLIPQKNPGALKQAILEALTDKQRREKAGRQNLVRARQEYDLKQQIRKLEKKLLQLLEV